MLPSGKEKEPPALSWLKDVQMALLDLTGYKRLTWKGITQHDVIILHSGCYYATNLH